MSIVTMDERNILDLSNFFKERDTRKGKYNGIFHYWSRLQENLYDL